jgi:hypothetical protein
MPGKCVKSGQITLPVYWYVTKNHLMQYKERSVQSVVKQTENKSEIKIMCISYDKLSLHERSDNSVVAVDMVAFRNDQLDFSCN